MFFNFVTVEHMAKYLAMRLELEEERLADTGLYYGGFTVCYKMEKNIFLHSRLGCVRINQT